MKRIFVILVAAVALASSAVGLAQAKPGRYYIPRNHHACRAHYKRETVKVRKRQIIRKHGKIVRRDGHKVYKWVHVKRAECVYVAPKKKLAPDKPTPNPTTPAPKISFSASVDPSYSQSAY